MTTQKPSDEIAVLATIDPDAYSANTYVSDYASFEYFDEMLAVVTVGDIGTSGTVNGKLRQATSSTGASVKDITSKAITALTQAGTDSDKQALINLRADELDLANGFKFVCISLTNATASADMGAVLLGVKPKHGPASGHDLASVDEIVA